MTRQPLPRGWTIHARWYLESNGTITPDVRVGIMDGSIQEIQRGLSAHPDDLKVDLLLPGLINAHCHLEYSHLAGVLPGGNLPFGEWLSSIMAQRGIPCTPERMANAVEELIQGGCTLVCDSSTDGACAPVLRELAMPHVIYREILGLTPERAAASLNAALQDIEVCLAESSDSCFGCELQPHAPYSVGPDLMVALRDHGQPGYAWHLAETQDENDLFLLGRGSIAQFLQSMGLPVPRGYGLRATEWMATNDLLHSCNVAFHGNALTLEEAAHFAAPRGIVHCPPTHEYFDRQPLPLRKWIDAGVNICLGTDSLASGDTLSMWECMHRVARDYPDLTAEEVLAMATLNPRKLRVIQQFQASPLANLTGITHRTSSPENPAELLQQTSPRITTIIQGAVRHDG